MVSQRKLGVPQGSRNAFSLLQTAGILPADLTRHMERMVGFRNIAIHEYTRLNLDVVRTIITKQLDVSRAFSSTIVKSCASPPPFKSTEHSPYYILPGSPSIRKMPGLFSLLNIHRRRPAQPKLCNVCPGETFERLSWETLVARYFL
ncbi:MAG: DUF86 domain-containing protein [Nitrospira sp.]|nr:DUF86 domain-containing protein [Nitrospira sp.]